MEKERKNASMKSILQELESKLSAEIENLKVAREQKSEISKQLEKCIKEKRDALEGKKDAEDKADDFRRQRDMEKKKFEETYARLEGLYNQIDDLKKEIQNQVGDIEKREREIHSLQKTLTVYKNQVDEINTRFGGMNAVDDAIRLAKMKEGAVGDLLQRLSHALVSPTCAIT